MTAPFESEAWSQQPIRPVVRATKRSHLSIVAAMTKTCGVGLVRPDKQMFQ